MYYIPGVGVHRILFISLSFGCDVAQPDALSIASARLDARAPIVVLSNNRLAAGVRFPAASDRLGVHDGGGIDPFRPGIGVRPGVRTPNSVAFARKLLEALLESLCDIRSRFEGTGR